MVFSSVSGMLEFPPKSVTLPSAPADMVKIGEAQQKKKGQNNGSISSTRVIHLCGVRSTRRPAGWAFAWVRNTRDRSLGGLQHRILVGTHAGCSVAPCPFLRRGFVIEQTICSL